MSINPAEFEPLKPGCHIHLIGVAGTGMSALARILIDAGFIVSGSDLRADPPTGPALATWGVDLRLGYRADNLNPAPDLVVVGNAVAAGHVEVEAAIQRGIPLTHMPALLDRIVGERPRLVIAGTHGKSTTTAITAWILEQAGHNPGWLIGAIPRFGPSGRLGTGPFVIEGDEYNAAYFDRRAKFFHYRPTHLAVTNVEFDHADLYADLDAIRAAFRELVASVPPGGTVILAPDAIELAEAAVAPVTVLDAARFELIDSGPKGARFRLSKHTYSVPLPGRHGAVDAALAIELAARAGVAPTAALPLVAAYPGLRLRQEVLAHGPLVVVRDFGHHPTEIAATLAGLRDQYPGRELWLVFEPRSFTSRTDRLRPQYAQALAAADRVWVMPVYAPERLGEPALDTSALAATLGAKAFAATDVDALVRHLERAVLADPERPRVLLLASNGTMEGVPERIVRELCR